MSIHSSIARLDARARRLRAALAAVIVKADEPELHLLHRWIDMGSPMFAPEGFGVAPTPWGAVQMAAWAAVRERLGG